MILDTRRETRFSIPSSTLRIIFSFSQYNTVVENDNLSLFFVCFTTARAFFFFRVFYNRYIILYRGCNVIIVRNHFNNRLNGSFGANITLVLHYKFVGSPTTLCNDNLKIKYIETRRIVTMSLYNIYSDNQLCPV